MGKNLRLFIGLFCVIVFFTVSCNQNWGGDLDKKEIDFKTKSDCPLHLVETPSESIESDSVGSPGSYSLIVNHGSYDILITLSWTSNGSSSINVFSANATTWHFSSWTQNSGVASWNGKNQIKYSLTGTIKKTISRENVEISDIINL